jgi:PAS domain S-box-containing protein
MKLMQFQDNLLDDRDPKWECYGMTKDRVAGQPPQEAATRKELQTDLNSAEEIFRLLVDAVGDYAIFALNPEGYILSWNLGGRRLKGYTAEEVIGTHFSRFYTPEDLARNHPMNELLVAREQGKYEEEGWRLRKDGTRFWANVVITALKDESGELRGFGKVTRDLTERRKADLALRESEERFRLMVESVQDYAIFMLDPKGYVSSWNKGAERTKGYGAGEIIGQHFSKFYVPEDIASDKPAKELVEAIKSGRFEEEGWRLRKDGSRFWASVVITPVYDKSQKLLGFAKVTRDLTERKKAEDALLKAYTDLEGRVERRTQELSEQKTRAEKAVRERDVFFSIASHELKTPLSSLKLQMQLRKRAVGKGNFSEFAPENLQELIQDDERQIERLVFLVDNLLDLSRLTSGNFELQPEEMSLEELVMTSIQRMEPILRESGNVCTFSCAGPSVGFWDRHRLEQVFTNLLSNAGKYAPGQPVEVSLQSDAERVTLRIRDYGPGISAANQARIFQPFERIKGFGEVNGLGLGLYITKQIIEAHHGRIYPESEGDRGITFVIEFPRRALSVAKGQ